MKIIAHRGYSKSYPENTILAFEKAIEIGCDMIETDVRLTKDCIPILFHDETLKRCANIDANVEDKPLNELLKLDIGLWFSKEFKNQKIPTLTNLIKTTNKRVTLILELKYQQKNFKTLCKEVIKQIKGKESWIEVSSFDDEILDFIHQLNPSTILHKLIDDKATLESSNFYIKYKKISYFDINIDLKEHPIAKKLIPLNNVILWTIDEHDISNEIKNGLYGAMANDPLILLKYINK